MMTNSSGVLNSAFGLRSTFESKKSNEREVVEINDENIEQESKGKNRHVR
jgi:hypothetical protein